MKSLKNKILVIAVLSMVLVACSKEEVKPFSCGGGATADFSTKSASDGIVNNDDSNANADNSGLSSGDQENDGTEEGDGSGITDGGTSSDYDSKGSKRKPGKN